MSKQKQYLSKYLKKVEGLTDEQIEAEYKNISARSTKTALSCAFTVLPLLIAWSVFILSTYFEGIKAGADLPFRFVIMFLATVLADLFGIVLLLSGIKSYQDDLLLKALAIVKNQPKENK